MEESSPEKLGWIRSVLMVQAFTEKKQRITDELSGTLYPSNTFRARCEATVSQVTAVLWLQVQRKSKRLAWGDKMKKNIVIKSTFFPDINYSEYSSEKDILL